MQSRLNGHNSRWDDCKIIKVSGGAEQVTLENTESPTSQDQKSGSHDCTSFNINLEYMLYPNCATGWHF